MRLFIAEKPSLGRAIADVLPNLTRRGGFHRDGAGRRGDLVHRPPAGAGRARCLRCRLQAVAHGIPSHCPDPVAAGGQTKTKAQLAVIKGLIKQADCVVNAGDPDREGQLLVDEVIDFLGYPKTKPVQRCLISDLNPPAVRRALDKLRDNKEFVPLAVSALARSRADWLYGINMTRAYTLLGRKGLQRTAVGGPGTDPLLGLVVRRDLEIEAFVPKPFYEVMAHLLTQGNERFTARWLPSEACLPWQDEEGRVLNRALAAKVVERIQGQPARVEAVEEQARKQAAPLPPQPLQPADRRGQALWHGCQAGAGYLPEPLRAAQAHHLSQIRQPPSAERALQPGRPGAGGHRQHGPCAGQGGRRSGWQDPQQGVERQQGGCPPRHHSHREGGTREPGADEAKLYGLIARQYLLQFYPPFEYNDSKVLLRIAGGLFQAKARRILKAGWKALLGWKRMTRRRREPCLP